MTAVDLLPGAIEQYVGDQEPPSTQQNPETTDDDVRRWKRVKQDLLSKHAVPIRRRAHMRFSSFGVYQFHLILS